MHTDMKYMFTALFMAFLEGFTFHDNVYVFDQRALSVGRGEVIQAGKIWREDLDNRMSTGRVKE